MHTFSLEPYLKRGATHLELGVRPDGCTYFDVFGTSPAEAVVDWPDFVDLPARYLEAAAMVEPLVGTVSTAKAIRDRLLSFIEVDGLAYRPDTPISHHVSELFDQSRLLYCLVSLAMHDPSDEEIRQHIRSLVVGLQNLATFENGIAYIKEIGVYFGGTLIRPLTQAALVLQEPTYLNFARALTLGILDHSPHFAPDGSFHGHVHGNLGTLAGFISVGILSEDAHVLDRARTIFDYARSISTEFGFVPELAQRKDDVIACETCAIMDYLDAAILLARHVDASYWEVVEKTARNHLVESQIGDRDWLDYASDETAKDEEGIVRSNLKQRIAGAFAGWSAPHGLLAYEETQQKGWVKNPELYPQYLGKVRCVQNCCAGAGIRALHQVWSNIAFFQSDTLYVNVLLDRHIEGAQIVSYAPFEGRAILTVERACDAWVRLPSSAIDAPFAISRGGEALCFERNGEFIHFDNLQSGDMVEIVFALPEVEEQVIIGNEGFKQYTYRVLWKGETVMRIEADSHNAERVFSHIEDHDVRAFYGPEPKGQLYTRSDWAQSQIAEPAPMTQSKNPIDWYYYDPTIVAQLRQRARTELTPQNSPGAEASNQINQAFHPLFH